MDENQDSLLSTLLPEDFQEGIFSQDLNLTTLLSPDDSTESLALQEGNPEQLALQNGSQEAEPYLFSVSKSKAGNGQVTIALNQAILPPVSEADAAKSTVNVEIQHGFGGDSKELGLTAQQPSQTISLDPGVSLIWLIGHGKGRYSDDETPSLKKAYDATFEKMYRVEVEGQGQSKAITWLKLSNPDNRVSQLAVDSLSGGIVRLASNINQFQDHITVGIAVETQNKLSWTELTLTKRQPYLKWALEPGNYVISIHKVDDKPIDDNTMDATGYVWKVHVKQRGDGTREINYIEYTGW